MVGKEGKKDVERAEADDGGEGIREKMGKEGPCSPEYCLASLPVKLHVVTTPNHPLQLKTMGAIVSHNTLQLSI